MQARAASSSNGVPYLYSKRREMLAPLDRLSGTPIRSLSMAYITLPGLDAYAAGASLL